MTCRATHQGPRVANVSWKRDKLQADDAVAGSGAGMPQLNHPGRRMTVLYEQPSLDGCNFCGAHHIPLSLDRRQSAAHQRLLLSGLQPLGLWPP